MKFRLVLGLVAFGAMTSAVQAQELVGQGPIIASYYNEEMSVPRGWSVSYGGTRDGMEIYSFIVDYETSTPFTRSLWADDQLKRIFCDGDILESWVRDVMRVAAGKVWFDEGNWNVVPPVKPISCG